MHDTVTHYLTLWNLKAVGTPVTTFSSVIVPVTCNGAPLILKLLKPNSDEQYAATCLTYWQGKGAVQIYQQDGGTALLMEKLEETPSLRNMVIEGKDDEAATIITQVINKLHTASDVPAPAVPTLEQRFRSLFIHAELAEVNIFYREAAALARELLTATSENVLLHGDIHHENILYSPRGWLAIDPKGVWGHRAYEVANLFRNPLELSSIVHDKRRMLRLTAICAEQLHLPTQTILLFAFVDACLSAVWAMEDAQDPQYSLSSAEILRKMI